MGFIRQIISVFNLRTVERLAVSALSCLIGNWIDENLKDEVCGLFRNFNL